MRIGFDFDNTIVSYDELFHKVALEQGVVPTTTPISKLAVRDYLRGIDKEDIWTEMQGYVYGARMEEAQSYVGVIDFIRHAKAAGHTLAIMSHKTKQNYLGTPYDLHAAARKWIQRYLCDEGELLIPNDHVFFEVTKEDKLARIGKFSCDMFIDDLPEILLAPTFPSSTQRYLFDPQQHHQDKTLDNVNIFSSWQGLKSCLK